MLTVETQASKIFDRTKIYLAIYLVALFIGVMLYLGSLSSLEGEDNYAILSTVDALPLDVSIDELYQQNIEWTVVELPIHWREHFAEAGAVWYKIPLAEQQLRATAADENSRFGLYLWRLNQTANVWFNGRLIGSGGRTSEPMARHWNSPLYFSIPDNLIEKENEILIKHFAQHSWGSMEAIVVGEESFLQPIFESRYFIQHDIALGLFVFVFFTGIFCFAVWFHRRKESEYFWFAAASMGLSFYCINQFIRYLPINADLWRWLSNVTTDLWASCIFIFMLRSLKLERPRTEKWVLAYLLSGIPVYFYASFFQAFDINIFYHAGSLLIAVTGLFICAKMYRETGAPLTLFYCALLLLGLIAGVHDTGMQAIVNNGWLNNIDRGFQNHYNFSHFAAPLVFLTIGISLLKRFIDSMNHADVLNKELEGRVQEASEELAENYRAIEKALVQQSASEERERIYRDLHDDVGSKLLSLYYRLDNSSDSILAKSALEDLRDIVSHKTLESCSLTIAAQQWRSEAFNRTQDASITLAWNFEAQNEQLILDESQHAQLRRMLREVISNAILHNENVTQICVNIIEANTLLRVSVRNDGSRYSVETWKQGRGISNLKVRSRELGGIMTIEDLESDWVQVAWEVPLTSADREQT